MPISYVGAATGTVTATLPAHQAGDLILVFAYRDGNNTAPTLPSSQGFINLSSNGLNNASARVAFKFATSNEETIGTWTNATSVIAAVYRGVDQTVYNIITAVSGGSSTTVTYPSLSGVERSANDWYVAFAGHNSTNTSLGTAPGAMTNRVNQADGTDHVAMHDSNGGFSSWSSTNVSVGGTSSGWRSAVVSFAPQAEEPVRQQILEVSGHNAADLSFETFFGTWTNTSNVVAANNGGYASGTWTFTGLGPLFFVPIPSTVPDTRTMVHYEIEVLCYASAAGRTLGSSFGTGNIFAAASIPTSASWVRLTGVINRKNLIVQELGGITKPWIEIQPGGGVPGDIIYVGGVRAKFKWHETRTEPDSSFEYLGSGTGVNSVSSMPTHAVGDTLIAFAYRDGSGTVPTVPAGWQTYNQNSAGTQAGVVAWRIATANNHSSGTWTNATGLIISSYRGIHPGSFDRFGFPSDFQPASQSSIGTGNAPTFNSLWNNPLDSDPIFLGFVGHQSVDTNIRNATQGYTVRGRYADATNELVAFDTRGPIVAKPSSSAIGGGTSSGTLVFQLPVWPRPVGNLQTYETDWIDFRTTRGGSSGVWDNDRNRMIGLNDEWAALSDNNDDYFELVLDTVPNIPRDAINRGIKFRLKARTSDNQPAELLIVNGDNTQWSGPLTEFGAVSGGYIQFAASDQWYEYDLTYQADGTPTDIADSLPNNITYQAPGSLWAYDPNPANDDSTKSFRLELYANPSQTLEVDSAQFKVVYDWTETDPSDPEIAYSSTTASTTSYLPSASAVIGYNSLTASTTSSFDLQSLLQTAYTSTASSEVVRRNDLDWSVDVRDGGDGVTGRQWSQFNSTETSAASVRIPGPFGTDVQANRILLALGNSDPLTQKGVQQVKAVGARTPNTTYCVSAYVKPDQCTAFRIVWTNSNTTNRFPGVRFDLVTNAISQLPSGSVTAIDSGIEDAADGWKRCWATFDSGTGENNTNTSFQLWGASTNAFTGAAGDGFWLYGPQVEIGTEPSTYQATTNVFAPYNAEFLALKDYSSPAASSQSYTRSASTVLAPASNTLSTVSYTQSALTNPAYTVTTVSGYSYTTAATANLDYKGGVTESAVSYSPLALAVATYLSTTFSTVAYTTGNTVELTLVAYSSFAESYTDYSIQARAETAYTNTTALALDYSVLAGAAVAYANQSFSTVVYNAATNIELTPVAYLSSSETFTLYELDFKALKNYTIPTVNTVNYTTQSTATLSGYTSATTWTTAYTIQALLSAAYSSTASSTNGYTILASALKNYTSTNTTAVNYLTARAAELGYQSQSSSELVYRLFASAVAAYVNDTFGQVDYKIVEVGTFNFNTVIVKVSWMDWEVSGQVHRQVTRTAQLEVQSRLPGRGVVVTGTQVSAQVDPAVFG